MNLKKRIVFYITSIIGFFFINFLSNELLILCFGDQNLSNIAIETQNSIFEEFILVVLFGPVLETFFFQTAIIEFFNFLFKRIKYYYYFSVTISALLFGLQHYYSLVYIIYGIVSGGYLGGLYIFSKTKSFNPTILVLITHMSWNLFVFLHKIY